MVEPLLYAALGFLTASLIALFMGRALWNRAVRLTTHRIMRRLPLSRDEIVAARDLLRAEVAIEHRRLERQANIMRNRMTQSMADVGRRDATIAGMRKTVEEAKAKSSDAELRAAAARKEVEQLKLAAAELKAKLTKAEGGLNAGEKMQKKHVEERAELIKLADDRRAEIATARGEIALMKSTLTSLEQQLEAARFELAGVRSELEQAQARKPEPETPANDMSTEDVQLLRQQIERLAGDIARVAAGPAQRPANQGSGALQSAARASLENETVSAAPVTFPQVQ